MAVTFVFGDTSNTQAFSNAVNALGGTVVGYTCCGTTLSAAVSGAVQQPPAPQASPASLPKVVEVKKVT